MAVKTIITPWEVVKYSPAGRDYPTNQIALLIPVYEQQIGYECLGKTLYEWLLGDLNEVPADIAEWECGKSYAVDDLVLVSGVLFKSETDLNTSDPTSDGSDWVEHSRFDSECANLFWVNHLRAVLAWQVYLKSVIQTTMTTGANGLTVLAGAGSYGNQGFDTANRQQIDAYKTGLAETLAAMQDNMIRWMLEQTKTSSTCDVPFSSAPGCLSEFCAPQRHTVRRWGFKH